MAGARVRALLLGCTRALASGVGRTLSGVRHALHTGSETATKGGVMAYQWRTASGLAWYEPATMRVFVDGVFVGLAQSASEAKRITRGF